MLYAVNGVDVAADYAKGVASILFLRVIGSDGHVTPQHGWPARIKVVTHHRRTSRVAVELGLVS